MKVAHPPPKPLLIWDGDCDFCRVWIERWRKATGDAVEYEPFQKIDNRFPEIPREQFTQSVVFVDTDGDVFTAAEAVFRSLGKKWLCWTYAHVPGFAAVAEFIYGLIARNRRIASAITRLFFAR